MNPIEILQAARQNIEKYGWTQGSLARDSQGNHAPANTTDCKGVCALGAIFRACDIADTYEFGYLCETNDSAWETAMEAIEALDELIQPGFKGEALEAIEVLTWWNDDLCRRDDETEEQVVLEVFDTAIERLQKAA